MKNNSKLLVIVLVLLLASFGLFYFKNLWWPENVSEKNLQASLEAQKLLDKNLPSEIPIEKGDIEKQLGKDFNTQSTAVRSYESKKTADELLAIYKEFAKEKKLPIFSEVNKKDQKIIFAGSPKGTNMIVSISPKTSAVQNVAVTFHFK